jgi:hypothetical protein
LVAGDLGLSRQPAGFVSWGGSTISGTSATQRLQATLKTTGKGLGSTSTTHGKERTKTAGFALSGHLVRTAPGNLSEQNGNW